MLMRFFYFLAALFALSGPLTAGPVFFRECCCRPPCSYITWRGSCDLPTYNLYADFLYWQNHPEGLDFARDGGIAASATTDVERGNILTPGCKSYPGLRIGLIVDLPCCCWDAFGQYTYLSNSFANSDSRGLGQAGLKPLVWNQGVSGDDDINFAEGKWKYEVNVFDFGMGNTFCVYPCLSFRPHLGFKATWQKLRYRVTYENRIDSTTTGKDQICFVTNFNGIGVRGGIDTQIKICRSLSFVGNLAMSALYSDLNTNRRDDHTDNIQDGNSPSVPNVWFNSEHCTLVPVTEIMVGIQWDMPLCNNYEYKIVIGWEGQIWWNMMQYLLINNSTASNGFEFGARGDITYQGLIARLGLSF